MSAYFITYRVSQYGKNELSLNMGDQVSLSNILEFFNVSVDAFRCPNVKFPFQEYNGKVYFNCRVSVAMAPTVAALVKDIVPGQLVDVFLKPYVWGPMHVQKVGGMMWGITFHVTSIRPSNQNGPLISKIE